MEDNGSMLLNNESCDSNADFKAHSAEKQPSLRTDSLFTNLKASFITKSDATSLDLMNVNGGASDCCVSKLLTSAPAIV